MSDDEPRNGASFEFAKLMLKFSIYMLIIGIVTRLAARKL